MSNERVTAGLLAAGTSLAFTIQSASASLIAYEGFDYAEGVLNGRDGGEGWAGAWVSGDTNVDDDATLAYQDSQGESLDTSGFGARINRVSRNAARTLAAPRSSDVTWTSFLFQPIYTTEPYGDPATTPETAFNVQLRNGTAVVLNLNKIESNDNYRLQTTDTGMSAQNNDLQFFVLRIDHGIAAGDAGSVSLFANTDITDTEPNPDDALVTLPLTGGFTFDGVRFEAPSGGLPSFEHKIRFDEIRVGTTYADVVGVAVPEPASIAILGLGGIALLRRRRR